MEKIRDVKLVYSPDDGGWYFDRYTWDGQKNHPGCFEVSQLFPTEAAAKRALREHKIKWEKEE